MHKLSVLLTNQKSESMKHTIITLSLLLSSIACISQTDCKVSLDALKGNYTGECNKGKANGQGVAIGKDKYVGQFSNGYPDGEGVYRWADSSYFKGLFKKGKREGKGAMHYLTAAGKDSLETGYWKKDKYIGKYENPYVVESYSGKVTRVSCRLANRDQRIITISIYKQLNATGFNNANIPQKFYAGEQILEGRYLRVNPQSLSNSQLVTFSDVSYPFKAIFSIGGEQVQISFYEPGEYTVDVNLL